MKADIRYIMLAVGDILELIEKANKAIEHHKNTEHPSELMIKQYQELKSEYVSQLADLLKDFDIKIEILHRVA